MALRRKPVRYERVLAVSLRARGSSIPTATWGALVCTCRHRYGTGQKTYRDLLGRGKTLTVGLDHSLKVAVLMTGCWSKDIRLSVLSEMGQGELMGPICCTRIPFILVMISQSHLSPLSKPYSSNPLPDPKTHFSTGTVILFLCHDSHNPLCL